MSSPAWVALLATAVATVTSASPVLQLPLAPNPNNCSLQCSGPANMSVLNGSAPRVMLFGDSISAPSSGYYDSVVSMLVNSGNSTEANIYHIGGYGKGICGTSFGALACFPFWSGAGQGHWDVIHFNWGLHDIAAKMYAPVELDQYVANMQAIIDLMRGALAPKGVMIWSTTTPVPPSYKNRVNSDVVKINAAMQTLLALPQNADVLQNDLYAQVVGRCHRDPNTTGYPETSDCTFLQSRGVHFSDSGKWFTGIMTSAAIAPHL